MAPIHSLWIDTMNRCFTALSSAPRRTAALALAALLTVGISPVGHAQTLVRPFPAAALRGELVVLQPPLISIDGEAARLSPGARIRNTQNTLVLSGTLVNQALLVNYLRDGLGLVHEVWILTATEAAEKRKRASE